MNAFPEAAEWARKRRAEIIKKHGDEAIKAAWNRLCLGCRMHKDCQDLPLQLDGTDCPHQREPKMTIRVHKEEK
jgi:hypothetical protein